MLLIEELVVDIVMDPQDGEVQVVIPKHVQLVDHTLSDHGDHVHDLVVQIMELNPEQFHVDIQHVQDKAIQVRVVLHQHVHVPERLHVEPIQVVEH